MTVGPGIGVQLAGERQHTVAVLDHGNAAATRDPILNDSAKGGVVVARVHHEGGRPDPVVVNGAGTRNAIHCRGVIIQIENTTHQPQVISLSVGIERRVAQQMDGAGVDGHNATEAVVATNEQIPDVHQDVAGQGVVARENHR